MDTILQELYHEIFKRMKPNISTPILTCLLGENLFRNLISNNYKLEYNDNIAILYRKEGLEWIEIKDFKAATFTER